MKFDCEYAIIGGGVAGLSAAIALLDLKKDFLVFEQAAVLKGIGAGFGLAANAMQAFDYLGLREEIEQIGYYTETYAILDHKGRTLIAPDTQRLSSRYNQKNFTVHRADLHSYLLSKLPSERILLGKRLKRFEKIADTVSLSFEDGTSYRCRYLIVADGVRSIARQQLIPEAKPRYAGYTCWRATIANGNIGLQHGSETWGPKGRFGMTPLIHDRIYWYACINAPQNSNKYKKYSVTDLLQNFRDYHYPIPEILSNTSDEDLLWNDIVDIKPLTRFAYDNILLIGDAAHATTPNMGQGACQALEDVAVLNQEIKQNSSIETAFKNFEIRRLKRTKYITDTSWKIGRAAQYTHPLMIGVRNTLLRILPTQWTQATLKKLLEVDFMAYRRTGR
jgi:2-polyprenyl-6-methoxyphenol hydroxylase and related FAD-dependent oxidoreductases